MRITCPSCKAVYEAPDDAIGAGGRVVECSDCGARWMQAGRVSGAGAPAQGSGGSGMPGLSAAAQAMSALRAPQAGAATASDEAQEAPRPVPAPPAAPDRSESESAQSGSAQSDFAQSDFAQSDSAQSDSSRSASTRPGSSPASRAQSAPAASRQGPGPIASPVVPPASAGAAPRRRDVASIDARELVAQLREAEAEEAPRSGAGRAVGFILALLISAAAAGAYLERERIAEAAPQTAPYLDRYAAVVDQARRAVDDVAGQVRGLIGG